MSRALDDLCPKLRTSAMEVIARLAEQSYPLMIVDTLRTPEEHEANLANGTSWTRRSKHLPRRVEECSACAALPNSLGTRGLSHAIDLVPYQQYLLNGRDKLAWDADQPAWEIIGEVGESLGLRWGGRWPTPDLGHLEYAGT